MDTAVLETALRSLNRENKVQKVISIKKEPAVKKGENFTSLVTKLTAKVILGNGREATKHFIMKDTPQEEFTSKMCKTSGIFKWETQTYKVILKGMEYLMEEVGDTDGPLWCQLIHHEPFNSIILEDLRDLGFSVVRRQSCLDLDHGILALRSLARFHAMAKVLEERAVIHKREYLPMALINCPNIIHCFFYYGFQALSKGIRKYWGDEWAEIAEKLKIPAEIMEEKMVNIGKLDETRFNVLNHGDCWANNLMFKYDWNKHPIAIRFLDFQGPHYNSPAIDLTYFIYLSMIPAVRRDNSDLLIEHYHEALLLASQKYKYEGRIITLNELKEEMERVSFFGLSIFAIRHAVYTTEKTDAMNLEKIFTSEGKEGLNIDVYSDLNLIDRMGPDLKYIVESLS